MDDVSLHRGVVTFQPNAWQRLKTATSHRSAPLWLQLREILQRYLAEHPPSRLLFPSYRTGEEAMLTDLRKLLDAVAVRARTRARQSTYTVAREMGHGGERMVRKV